MLSSGSSDDRAVRLSQSDGGRRDGEVEGQTVYVAKPDFFREELHVDVPQSDEIARLQAQGKQR